VTGCFYDAQPYIGAINEPLRMVTMEMTLQISQACTSVQFLNRRSSEECCDR